LAFSGINGKNIELFKLFTTLTLPVTYSEHFYIKMLTYKDFSLLGKTICDCEGTTMIFLWAQLRAVRRYLRMK
jgi:hypothetical protein